ncbi:MAG: hypothetical protein ACKODX_04625 [Gemmata sp.]
MAQMITLEEAAARLGITPEEMKKRLKTDPEFKKLSQIRDGATIRFKQAAIDDLGRQLGMASEEGLPLPPLGGEEPPGSDDFRVSGLEDALKKTPKKPTDDAPLDFGTSDDDVFSLAEEPPATKGPKSSGRLVPKAKGDSDVRLDNAAPKKPSTGDVAAVPTEEIALDLSGSGSAVIKGGNSAKLPPGKGAGSSGKLDAKGKGKNNTPANPAPTDSSSEFELSLDADSDDFDLQLSSDSGDEVDLGSLPKDKAGSAANRSGIKLNAPADSGISLEQNKTRKNNKDTTGKAKKGDDDSDASDVDFELSLDSSAPPSSTKLGGPKSGKLAPDAESDSEFELTLDDSGGSLEQAALEQEVLEDGAEDKGDIFETDFEIPQMPDESASEAVALESDTDLEKEDIEVAEDDSDDVALEEESGSEVVVLDDDEEDAKPAKGKAARGKAKKLVEEADADVDVDLGDDAASDEEDGSASKALAGAAGRKPGRADEDDADFAATKPWGIVPVLFLAPALLLTITGALMGYELIQTMWGYQQPRKPTAPIVRGIATQLDMELKDQ